MSYLLSLVCYSMFEPERAVFPASNWVGAFLSPFTCYSPFFHLLLPSLASKPFNNTGGLTQSLFALDYVFLVLREKLSGKVSLFSSVFAILTCWIFDLESTSQNFSGHLLFLSEDFSAADRVLSQRQPVSESHGVSRDRGGKAENSSTLCWSGMKNMDKHRVRVTSFVSRVG